MKTDLDLIRDAYAIHLHNQSCYHFASIAGVQTFDDYWNIEEICTCCVYRPAVGLLPKRCGHVYRDGIQAIIRPTLGFLFDADCSYE